MTINLPAPYICHKFWHAPGASTINLHGIFVIELIRLELFIVLNVAGFENPSSSCCHMAGRFGGLIPCGPTSIVCWDRSKYVFWDPYHPTDAANVIIAKRLLDGDHNDIFPMNVRQLFQA